MSDFSHESPDFQPLPPPDAPGPQEPYSPPADTPMTAPDIAANYEEERYPDADTPSEPPVQPPAEEAPSTPLEDFIDADADPVQTPEEQARIREEAVVREGVLSLAQWLGPKLAELGIPPDAGMLVEPRPETAPPLSEEDAALAEEFKRGWLVLDAGAPWGPEQSPESDMPGDRWRGAVAVPPSGRLVSAEGTFFQRAVPHKPLGDNPKFNALDERELRWNDNSSVDPENPSDRVLLAFTSASIAEAFESFMERYGLTREDVPPTQEDVG